jgi:hypothetical protein
VRECENSVEAMCGGSGMVVFRGFQQYIEPLKTTKIERTKNDRARYLPENTNSAEKKIRCGKKIKVIQNLCSDTMLKVSCILNHTCKIQERPIYIG